MDFIKTSSLLIIVSSLIFAQSGEKIIATPEVTPTVSQKHLPFLDKGMLDQNWFSTATLQWSNAKNTDFIWTKPGLALNKKSIAVSWERPMILSGATDEWDRNIANELTEFIPEQLYLHLSQNFEISKTTPQIKLIGRTVECNVCTSLIFSPAMEVHTFDIKLIDAFDGELLMAVHHRTVDGWGAKGNGIKRDFKKWSKYFVKEILTKYSKHP